MQNNNNLSSDFPVSRSLFMFWNSIAEIFGQRNKNLINIKNSLEFVFCVLWANIDQHNFLFKQTERRELSNCELTGVGSAKLMEVY